MRSFYFDTSIWLDFFEDRDLPNLPKSEWATKLIKKIVKENNRIIYSNANEEELIGQGYTNQEIESLFKPIKSIIINVEFTRTQFGKAKDLAQKRNIPVFDALHALIARDNKATLVTLDHDFQKLKDIVSIKGPQDII